MKSNYLLANALIALALIFVTGPAAAQQLQKTATVTVGTATVLTEGSSSMGGQTIGKEGNTSMKSPMDPEWSHFYGGTGKDECYAAIQTSDGGYIMVGRSNAYGAGDFDAWLVKTDAQGTVTWTKTYGDTYIDEAYMVKELSGGGYIITGMTTQFGWAGEGWLIRTDAGGNIVWSKGYHPSVGSSQAAWDYLYDVVENPDGSFTAVGDGPTNDMNIQAWILKVDADGNLLWDHTYGGVYWERIFSMAATSDGGYVGVGDRHWSYNNDSTFRHDGWLLKFNDQGDTTWTRHWGSEWHDIFRCVKQTTDGGYIIAGEHELNEVVSFQGWMVRTDAGGNEIFNKTFSRGGLYGVQQAADGNFLAAGTTTLPGTACQGWFLKTAQGGQLLWESLLDGTDLDDMFLSLNPVSDGGYILGGKYNHEATTGSYWLVKSAPDGILPLSYFFENFDAVTPPALPENWSGVRDVLLSNTVAEVKSMDMGSTTSLPNSTFIMNGLDGSNGQRDTSAFVALVTPYVVVGSTGATLTFWAEGGNNVIVGTMSDPQDPATFVPVEEVTLTYNFEEHVVPFSIPGNTWIALKNANASAVTPVFADDMEYKQNVNTGIPQGDKLSLKVYPNPASDRMTIAAPAAISTVRILNSLGAVVWSSRTPQGTTLTLNTSGYSTGNYIVTIVTENGTTLAQKFCISR